MLDCIVTAVLSVPIKKKQTSKLVDFCTAILILKMEEYMQLFGILCFTVSRKVKTQLKCKKKICIVHGEGAAMDQTCQKWFAKLPAGDSSLDDAPRSVDQLKLAAVKSRLN